MKKIYSFLILLMLSLSVKSQVDYTIGSATGQNTGTTYPCPIQDFYEGSRSQFLYLASELQAAGMGPGYINSIKFNAISITAPTTFSAFPAAEQLTISIGTTATPSLSTTVWETGTTAVFGPVDYTITVGLNEFILSTPFFWNGTDNIVLDICNGDPNNATYVSYSNNAIFPFTSGLSFNGSHIYRSDNLGNFCGHADALDNSGGSATTRPDAIFNWVSATACSGTPTAGDAVSSRDTVCSNIGFNLYATGATLASGLTYQWESSTDGGNYSPIAGATGYSYNVSAGITTTTWYRRQITCSGNTTISTPKMVFVRPFYECYCSPLTNNTLYAVSTDPTIESIDIVGTSVNYNNSHPGSNAAPTLGYAFFTDTTGTTNPAIPSLRQAVSYTMTVTTSSTPTGAGYWIDWNHNGLYDSAEYVAIIFKATTTAADISIDVPANAPLGLTMMRIRTRNATFTYNNACTNFGNGETEDYIFQVLPGLSCTGAPVGGSATSIITATCPNQPFILTVDNATTGVTGLVYQWQDSTEQHGWADVAGATNRTYAVATGINKASCYRRKITCSNSNLFSYSSSVCITMNLIVNCYCSPLNGVVLHSPAGADPQISQINIDGGTTAVVAYQDVPVIDPTNSYYLNADTTNAPSLAQATSYTLTVAASTNPGQAAVWIDWNQNGKFDASEYQLITFTGTTGTVIITPPLNAVLGITAMRVRVRAATFTTDACQQYGSGSTTDYAIRITPGTNCSGTPLGGDAASTATSVCPNVKFVLSVNNATDGVIGLSYQWQDSTAQHGWANIAGATGVTDTVAGISVATCYRRKITCSYSSSSSYSNPICLTMNAIFDCYCNPLNGTILHTSTGPTIESIALNGGTLAYTNSSPGAATNGYTSFTDTSLAPALSQAIAYTLTVNTSANPGQAAVWIDWDHSGSFEPSEYQLITFASGATTADLMITPAANALTGFTMMRIRVRAATFTSDACLQYGSGETEDYVIKIIPGNFCVGVPVGGSAEATTATACNGTLFTLSVTSASDGFLGLHYQWQDSLPNLSWVNTAVADTNLTLKTSQNVPTYYRRKISCSYSSSSSYSTPVFVDQLAVTYAALPYTEDFENTWLDGCGDANSRTIPNNSWRSSPLMSDSSWRRNDDGTAASWVNVGLGTYSPTSSTGSYSARFHSYQAAGGTSGNLDLYVNCSGGSATHQLSFDYINTSGTDSAQVLLSTDGGANFIKVGSFTTATTWTTKNITFASLSPTVVIRFRATSDFGTTDIGLDNLNIVNINSIDLVATALAAPTGNMSVTSAGTISITVTNNGGNTMDFAATNATIGASVKVPSGATVSYNPTTLNSGTLAAGASQTYTVTNAANFSVAGNYTVKAWVNVTGDANNLNDTTNNLNFLATAISVYAVSSGNWGDGTTWSTGTVPLATDTVTIAGYTVTLGGASPSPYYCSSLGIGNGGTLSVTNSVLNIGATGGSNKSLTLAKGATLNIAGGTLNQNGFIIFNDSSNFTMSSGNLNIDGNNGTDAGSVPAGVDLLGFGTASKVFSFGNINITGGTITFVDPHRFGGNTLGYRGSVAKNIGAGNTIVIGNPSSTQTSNTGFGGFVINTSGSTSKLTLGNLTINGGNIVGNRFATATGVLGVNGDLTVNANSEFRLLVIPYITGNLINNGIFACSAATNFQTFLNGVAGAVTTTQSISGTGVFRNNIPSATVTGTGTGYAVGDILTLSGGVSTTPATVYVLAVSASGNITSSVLLNMGSYTTAPTGTLTASGGNGSGATYTSANLVTSAKFAGLTVNNTSAGGLVFSSLGATVPTQNGTISGTLTMLSGIINNGTNTLTLGASLSQKGVLSYTSGVVTGKFRRWFTTAVNTGVTGDFPVGKTTYAKTVRVEFTTAPTKGGTLTAEFIATPPGLGGFPITDGSATLLNVSNDGFWRVDADSITGGNYTVSLTDSGIIGVANIATLTSVKRPSSSATWFVDGAAGTNTGTTTKPTVVRTGLSSFSEFAIAGAFDNVLPIASMKLSGEKVGSTNHLNWTVINETNIQGYDLQRSNDGNNYSSVNFVLSKEIGTINPKIDYTYVDYNSITNDGYYRLKQIAKDGSIVYSNVVLIKGTKVSSLVVGNIYPNPVKELLNLIVGSSVSRKVIVMVTDMNGKQVLRNNYSLNKGDNSLQIKLGNISVGTYAISIVDIDGNMSNITSFIKEQ